MPPREELFAPFEAVLRFKAKTGLQVIEWKNTTEGLCLRPSGHDASLIWFVPNFSLSETWYNPYIAWLYENKSFFRLVPFAHKSLSGEGWLVLRPDASGIICGNSRQRANWKANLNWEEKDGEFLCASLENIQGRVVSAIAVDPEEWERACQWVQQDDDERFWGIVSWQHGNPGEWKNLMRAALQIASLQDEKDQQYQWGIFILERPRFAFAPLQMGRGGNQHAIPASLTPLLKTLEKHFRPRIDYSRSGCTWKPPFYSKLNPSKILCGGKPTHHELMEAIEIWRGFGRESGQLAQVEACLQQLLT